jgi:GNAT superfamily N-acetyltransferase
VAVRFFPTCCCAARASRQTGGMAADLLALLHAAARGAFPPQDGRTDVVPAVVGAPVAALSFTAHHVVAADLPADEVLARVDPEDLKGPLAPAVLTWLAEQTGLVAGSLDVLLAWVPGRAASPALVVREVDPGDAPRIDRARRWRRELRGFEADGGTVLLGRGLAGRLELSVEVPPQRRDRGLARRLAAAALAAAAPDEPVFAQVAAANAASLRALQPAGFAAVGAEVLLGPGRDFLRRSPEGVVAPGP